MREELLLTYLAIFLQLYKKTSHIGGVRSALGKISNYPKRSNHRK